MTDEPDRVTDGTRVRRTVYGGVPGGAGGRALTIEGGGHTWPGRAAGGAIGGAGDREIDATPVIWAFFVGHPKP